MKHTWTGLSGYSNAVGPMIGAHESRWARRGNAMNACNAAGKKNEDSHRLMMAVC
ncbi:hypothetical protein [Nitrosospira sp. Nsp11]|uniref:hypothetical protein n=1 Tax=Nitrosospira sp. Nsp11 TaxID=1855338 RepID=UPI0015B61004|nr:hypothetical protein [Nitrosospira sp. Nsp11]